MPDALAPTPTIDSDHPAVVSFAEANTQGARNARERAVKLYYAVRDGIRYDPYTIDLSIEGLRASATLDRGHHADVPVELIRETFRKEYSLEFPPKNGDFDRDVEKELPSE